MSVGAMVVEQQLGHMFVIKVYLVWLVRDAWLFFASLSSCILKYFVLKREDDFKSKLAVRLGASQVKCALHSKKLVCFFVCKYVCMCVSVGGRVCVQRVLFRRGKFDQASEHEPEMGQSENWRNTVFAPTWDKRKWIFSWWGKSHEKLQACKNYLTISEWATILTVNYVHYAIVTKKLTERALSYCLWGNGPRRVCWFVGKNLSWLKRSIF